MGLALFLFVVFVSISSVQAEADKVRLKAFGCPLGSTAYIATFAAADILNKHCQSVSADAIETSGSLENIKTLMLDPKLRVDSFIYSSARAIHQASVGDPPFNAKYSELKAIARLALQCSYWVTFDKTIKSVDDFVGKRVATGPKGSIISTTTDLIFKYGLGTFDKIKFEYLGFSAAKDALLDGRVDVAVGALAYIGDGRWVGNPATREILKQKRRVYIIGTPGKAIELTKAKSGYPYTPLTIPAKVFGPQQKKPVTAIDYRNGIWADKRLDDNVVYDMCKTWWNHVKDFATYHKSLLGVTHETMPKLAFDEKDFHRGAIKFYKEQNAKIGYH